MNRKFLLFFLFIYIFNSVFIFSQNKTPEPYGKEEFHPVLKDLRRAEIITLGAMPFITLGTSLGFSFGKYAYHGFDAKYFANPFEKTDNSVYTNEEQVSIILTSLGISLGIGIADFVVQSVKRASKTKKIKNNNKIQITPISQDPEALKIKETINSKEIMIEKNNELSSFEENNTSVIRKKDPKLLNVIEDNNQGKQ